MGLEDKRQELSGGGRAAPVGKSVPSPKEEKKDTSVFKGRQDIETGNFMFELKDPRLFSKTGGLDEARRLELGKKVFKSFGTRIDPSEIKKAKDELSQGKWGQYKEFSQQDKIDTERLIRGLEHLGE